MHTGRRLSPLFVALLLAGCTEAAPIAPSPVAPATETPAPAPHDDAPLPEVDEVPAFLQEVPAAAAADEAPPRWEAEDLPVEVLLDDRVAADFALAAPEPTREPTLAELMRQVQLEDGEGVANNDEAWAFIGGSSEEEDEEEPASPTEPADEVEVAIEIADVEEAEVVLEVAEAPEPAADDPCAPLRRQLERRQDYLRRTAAERDAFGYVESDEDAQALRLLQGLRRCADHPDDADCLPPALERDISELEQPAHRIHRRPHELNAEGKLPDEIPHDPLVLDLLHELQRCERRTVAQPLLQPKPQR